jgi:hypothetical protein
MYSGAVKKMYCNTLLSIKFILGPVGSGFVPSRSKNLKTMEHSDAQLSIIRVFQYFQVLWSGTLFLHLVLLGFVGVTRSFLYLFLRTGLASMSSPQGSRPPTDHAESPEQQTEDSTKPHFSFCILTLSFSRCIDLLVFLSSHSSCCT